jgi:hypothetical protein
MPADAARRALFCLYICRKKLDLAEFYILTMAAEMANVNSPKRQTTAGSVAGNRAAL